MTKQQPQLKAVLFDYGGVLADEGFHHGLVALAKEQGLNAAAMLNEGKKAVYDSGFVLGHGSAADFWTLMRERTGLAGEDQVLTQRILSGFVLRSWMIEGVRKCQQHGFITGILSDQTHWLDDLNERDHFYASFDIVFNSYYHGKGKQDPSLFIDVASKLELSPGQILFVDDDAGNINRAQSVGMQVLLYVDKETFIQELKRLTGVHIPPI